ncbi:MAG TPA: hypothetical protein VL485_10515, partial [Ktedonobacteraceae bacterium]|nr:hypothetical protein [Ktedonobacteraceae bacterium]
ISVTLLLVCDRGRAPLRPGCSPIGDSRRRPGRRQAATLRDLRRDSSSLRDIADKRRLYKGGGRWGQGTGLFP